MEIKSAEFVISNTDVRKCPEGNKPEYAFIGRSNVGKSSLINMLTNKKGLARAAVSANTCKIPRNLPCLNSRKTANVANA